MSNPVIIFATIRPKPEHFADAKRAIEAILKDTIAEEGCEIFELYTPADQTGTLHLWEKFSSEAALTFHYEQPYTKSVFASYQDWLAEPVHVQRLVASGAPSTGHDL